MSFVVLDRVRVPNLPSREFVKSASRRLELDYLDPDYLEWDFVGDDRGCTFETRLYFPDRDVIPAKQVLLPFAKRGFTGSTAAFIAWMMEHGLAHNYATIPDDARSCKVGKSEVLCVPHSSISSLAGGRRRLCLHRSASGLWEADGTWHFLGFKKVKKR